MITQGCVERIKELGQDNTVRFYWIPGHVGIEGNEIADQLAKKGASSPMVGPEPFCGTSMKAMFEEFQRKEYDKTKRAWTAAPGLRQAKTLIGNYDQRRTKALLALSKNSVRILTGFLTGHCRLAGHLVKIGVVDSGECRLCMEGEETSLHLLLECPATANSRRILLEQIEPNEAELRSLDIHQILKFLKKIGIHDEL